MPLKLVDPRPGRSPYYRIRGTYLGVYIDRSSGTGKRAVAQKKLKSIEGQIEHGDLTQDKGTFAHAVVAYLKGGGERKYTKKLLEHFKTMRLSEFNQAVINRAAAQLYPPGITEEPSAQNATINRQVFTPVSAILAAGGYPLRLNRPKQPTPVAHWISPEEAATWLGGTPEKLRRLTVFLLYTGCRITEACNLTGEHIDLREKLAYLGRTKNSHGRGVHLPPSVMEELRGVDLKREERVFGYRDRWEVYDDWAPLRESLEFPEWWTPHACCHTWATWMRQYAGRDLRGLLGTGRWRDLKSVLRYQHVVTTEESRSADLLPPVRKPWTKRRKSTKTGS